MLFKVASYRVPANARNGFTKAVQPAIAASKKEGGVVGYRGGFDLDDQEVFVITGLYKDEPAFESHVNSDHLKKALSQLAELMGGDSGIEFMSAASFPCTEEENSAEAHVRQVLG